VVAFVTEVRVSDKLLGFWILAMVALLMAAPFAMLLVLGLEMAGAVR
jgi:hypothetical protein